MSKLFTRLAILCLVFVLAACAPSAPVPEAEEAGAPAAKVEEAAPQEAAPAAKAEEAEAMPSKYTEAPMLAERVAAGELPPVDDRLPNEPFVVGPGVLVLEQDLPDWQPGKYGGTIRAAHAVADWAPDVFVMINEPLLSAPSLTVQDIRGNILKDFEVNDDNTEFTFHMREGLKWSDGEPVTSEDIRFTYEDVLLNEKITPAFPSRFRTGGAPDGDPMNLEIIDDYTFKASFSEPYGGFLRQIVIEKWVGYTELLKPAHYLKQFHADYASMEELRPHLDEQNLEDEWWQLFTLKDCLNWNLPRPRCIGFPALSPWIIVESQQPGVLSFERNPYYYKVDTEGKQLPYVDKIVSVQAEDVEAVNLKVLTGDVDFLRESTGLVKIPLYKENEDQAGFRVHILDMHVDSSALFLNQTFEDETWRSVAQDVRFRQALSMAINRDEIIESIYYGFASYPLKTVGEANATYDPEKANQLLDEVGLSERNADGLRLGPDGEVFSILIEHGAHAPDISSVAELIAEYLKDVGLDVQVKQIDPQLWGQRMDANEIQATVFWTNDQGWDDNWTGRAIEENGRLWWDWYNTGGEEGEEPPAWVTEAFEIDKERWSVVSGSEEYNALKEAGFAWDRENLPLITVVENVKYPMIANQNLGNIPKAGFAIAANFSGEQLFFDQ
jgi:peptide/nickel transport system substrate-binding protein